MAINSRRTSSLGVCLLFFLHASAWTVDISSAPPVYLKLKPFPHSPLNREPVRQPEAPESTVAKLKRLIKKMQRYKMPPARPVAPWNANPSPGFKDYSPPKRYPASTESDLKEFLRLSNKLLYPDTIPAHPVSVPWNIKTSAHFLMYQEPGRPDNTTEITTMQLESLYAKSRLTGAIFAPWPAGKKAKIYIYRGSATYLSGEFKPPKWSAGVAHPDKKTIATYYSGDTPRMLSIIAHELSHLYFASFFIKSKTKPPLWLDEGLAVLMGDLSYKEEGPWTTNLKRTPGDKFMPLERLFGTDRSKLYPEELTAWYLKSFGTVNYLLNNYSSIQFRNFCVELRKGSKLENALWKIYRIKNIKEFDRAWLKWVKIYKDGRKPVEAAS